MEHAAKMTDNFTNWPRIRDLPEEEREPFRAWLGGQTVPVIEGVPDEEQDGFYWGDYEIWKEGLPVID